MVQEHAASAMLAVYMPDGWSVLASASHEAVPLDGFVAMRVGRLRGEFLLQRGFLKIRTGSISSEALALHKRRSTFNCFAARVDFKGLLRISGAIGVAESASVIDGLMFVAMRRFLLARHVLYYSTQGEPGLRLDHWLLWALDWLLFAKCVSHALQNSVLWSLKAVVDLGDAENSHVAVQSLINARCGLALKVDRFIAMYASLVATYSAADDGRRRCLHLLEGGLQVDRTISFEFDPVWDGTALQFHENCQRYDDCFAKLKAMPSTWLRVVYHRSVCHRRPLRAKLLQKRSARRFSVSGVVFR